jgi:dTMP kinase
MIIALEGIDACGKHTQVRMLSEVAEAKGIQVLNLSFPNYLTETGQLIRDMLTSEVRGPLLLQSMMTINRYEVSDKIDEAQLMGKLIILDRYWMSGWVYGQTDGIDHDWLETIHRPLVQPHQWIVLDMPVEESFRRRPVREDLYESDRKRLEKARSLYLQASRRPCFDPCEVIDASKPKEWVHHEIVRCCEL